MLSSFSSTSEVDVAAVVGVRSSCFVAVLQTAVEVVGVAENVVITASSVGSGMLQADPAPKQKLVPECLLKSTEAISSSRLCSADTNTQNAETEKHLRQETGIFLHNNQQNKSFQTLLPQVKDL